MSALAAEATGVDLIHVVIPDWHENVAKDASLNFQVHPFDGDSIEQGHTGAILALLATMDCAVIGPGIAKTAESIEAITTLVAASVCPLVLDATAIQPDVLALAKGKDLIFTPHEGELERLSIDPSEISDAAKKHNCCIHLKGMVDRIACDDGSLEEVEGGNAGLTVGGTGDVLAGLIGGFVAQGMDKRTACVTSSRLVKRAGSILQHEKGYAYTAADVIGQIPSLLREIDDVIEN